MVGVHPVVHGVVRCGYHRVYHRNVRELAILGAIRVGATFRGSRCRVRSSERRIQLRDQERERAR
jgi:hypothetical protein